MARRKKKELRWYSVPFEITLRGSVDVEAESAEAAEDIVTVRDALDTDELFFIGAEMTDWNVVGDAEEIEL